MGWECGVEALLCHRRPFFWERGGSEQMEEDDVKKCNPGTVVCPKNLSEEQKWGFCSMQNIPMNDDLRQKKQRAPDTLRVGGGINNSK